MCHSRFFFITIKNQHHTDYHHSYVISHLVTSTSPSTAIRSVSSASQNSMVKRNGRRTSSPRMSTTYECRPTSKESVRLSMSYFPVWISRSRSNPSQWNPDFHRVWKATIYLTDQVMMPHPCWRRLRVNQAALVRETLPRILPCLREHLKSQRKGVGL
jgi:hypothetical protein